jgi:hypothetical protein
LVLKNIGELTNKEYAVGFLNKRSGEPTARNDLKIVVEYPEPGVLRRYCGTDVVSWSDEVISKEAFVRKESGNAH